ncbi:MAG: hypothetical protein A3J79_11450 [Elusimicrobia bacterium RIFOXYB2_FULL_62_6]|nr:MAG: hypothetical protein A3J79_11450 [Elusimicrobia bacterium RIFOXYB2_FULL_62_6]
MRVAILNLLLLAFAAASVSADAGCGVYSAGREMGCADGTVCDISAGSSPADCRCRAKDGTLSGCRGISASLKAGTAPPPGFVPLPMPLLPGQQQGGTGPAHAGDPQIMAASARYQAGLKAYDSGDHPAAIEAFKEAVSLNPDMLVHAGDKLAHSYLQRGLNYSGRREYDKAIDDFKEALRLKPDLPKAKFAYASALDEKRRGSGTPRTSSARAWSSSRSGPRVPAASGRTPPGDPGAVPAPGEPINTPEYPGGRARGDSSYAGPGPAPRVLAWAIFLLVIAVLVWGRLALRRGRLNPFGPAEPPGPDGYDREIRRLMDSGGYGAALAAFSAKDARHITAVDRINLFEIHLRMGNVDSAWAAFESVKGSPLLAANPAVREKLAALCTAAGLDILAEELGRLTAGPGR